MRGAAASRRGQGRQESLGPSVAANQQAQQRGSSSSSRGKSSGHRRSRISYRDQNRVRQDQYEGWSQQERSALYLSANCRFGLLDSQAVRSASASADLWADIPQSSTVSRKFSLGFDWDDDVVFLEMDVQAGLGTSGELVSGSLRDERLRCPISLDTLELPVVTPCGHVFSLVSVATDMVLREAMHGPCPICTKDIVARELKPLKVRVVDVVERNGVVSWRLMRKGEGGVIACEGNRVVDKCVAKDEMKSSFSYPIVMSDESRFQDRVVVENPEDLYRYMVCRLAARSEEVAAEGGSESEYFYLGYVTAIDIVVEIAKRMIARLRGEDAGLAMASKLRAHVEAALSASKRRMEMVRRQERFDQDFPSLVVAEGRDVVSDVDIATLRVRCRSLGGRDGRGPRAGDAAGMTDAAATKRATVETMKTGGQRNSAGNGHKNVHFYQSADGQRYYLNDLNTEMLRRAGLPDVVSGARVLDIETYEQTVVTRRAVGQKLYAHVPLSAMIGICEVDLKGIVPEDVMDEFKERVDKNREERESKALKAFLDQQDRRKAVLAAKKAAEDAVSAMLDSMPRLGVGTGQEGEDKHVEDAVEDTSGPIDSDTPSWAILAKDGFAATGPSLGGSPSSAPSPLSMSQQSPPVWGTSPVPEWGPSMATSRSSWAPPDVTANLSKQKSGGKGKKVTLFSSSSGRNYTS